MEPEVSFAIKHLKNSLNLLKKMGVYVDEAARGSAAFFVSLNNVVEVFV